MSTDISVPVKLLKEFIEKKVTVDTSNGEYFTGTLEEVEDNMSVNLSDVKAVLASGHTAEMENVYIRGHKVRLISLPEEAKESVNYLNRQFNRSRGGGSRGRGGFRGNRPSYGSRR